MNDEFRLPLGFGKAALLAFIDRERALQFRWLLGAARTRGYTDKKLRAMFGVSKPTFEAWLAGTSAPHPSLVKVYTTVLQTELGLKHE